MKKNFVKRLAVALSLAMTVSTLAPAASADAAAAPAFKSYKTSVYENGTNNGSYTYTVKNIKKNYTVKWSVTGDGKAYVTVSKDSTKASKTTVSNTIKVATNGEAAAKNAKATVTAKVYDTKNKLVKTIKDAVTVKVQATDVAIKAADGSNFETAVGEKYDLNRTLTPANSTSKTYWTVDSEDATIDSQGVLTATKAGEYTVTATVRNAKTSKDLASATQKVTVKEAVLKSVSQTKATELAAVFAGATDKVQNSDFVITRTSDNVVFPVSKVTVDSTDKTKVTLTTFSKMADGKEYTVKYGETTLTFVATDGKATSLVVDPITVPFNEKTEIHVLGKDANGVVTFDSTMTNKDTKLDITVETTQGYMTGDELVLLEKGNTAKVTATLHTYEYNTDGTEKDVLKVEATITAVDPEAVSLTGTRYTVAKTLDWTKAVNTKIAIKENAFLFFELKNSKGKDVTGDYTTVDSSDTNTLLVACESEGKATLVPVKEGTAYALVKDKDGNVVASFAITVVAERKVASIVLNPTSVNLSKSVASDSAVVKLTAKDQYGDDMSAPASVTITGKNKPSSGDYFVTSGSYASGKINVAVTSDTVKGTYVYEVKAGDVTRALTVNVQEAPGTGDAVYKVALSTNKVDTTITNDYDGNDIAIDVAVGQYRGNVKIDDISLEGKTVEVTNAKGEAVTASAINVSASGSSIIVAKNNSTEIDKLLGAGSYTIKIRLHDEKDTVLTTGFVVEDKQPGVTYNVKKNTASEGDIIDAVQNSDVVEFKYNGTTIPATDITVDKAESRNSGNTWAAIKVKVKVTVKVGDIEYKVPAEVTLNQSITINQ